MDRDEIPNINGAVKERHLDSGIDAETFNVVDVSGRFTATTIEDVLAEMYDDYSAYDDELKDLSAVEIQQLQNINTVTVSNTQWEYLGEQDQSLKTTNDVTFNTVTIGGTILNGSHAATKDYVDAVAQGQIDYQDSVMSFWDASSALPSNPSTNDRYICIVSGNGWTKWNIYEYNGSSWDEIVINEGAVCWVEDEDIKYIYNGSDWVKFGSTLTHNNLNNIFGSNEGYHISQTQYNNILLKTDSVTDLSDVTSAGSGVIISNQERSDINGSVTVHNDVSDAGSGVIISTTERSNFGSAYTHSTVTSGNPHSIDATDVGLGNVDNVANTNQTTLGTVTSGDVTAIDSIGKISSKANGDIFYWNTSLQRLVKGTDGQYLKLVSGLPSWSELVTHDAVTIGTANGLSLDGQELSLGTASASTTGALTSDDWNTFNGKQPAGNYLEDGDFTANGLMKRTSAGTYTTITDSSTNWDTAYTHSTTTTGNPHSLDSSDVGAAPSSHSHGNITNAGAIGSTSGLPIITTTSGVLTTGSFGTASGTFCEGDDSRLSNSRTPTAHAIDGALHTVSASNTNYVLKITGSNTFDFAQLGFSNLSGNATISQGGTNITTYTAGDILYASATNTLSKLAKGTDNELLTLSSGIPSWKSIKYSASIHNIKSFTDINGEVYTGTWYPTIVDTSTSDTSAIYIYPKFTNYCKNIKIQWFKNVGSGSTVFGLKITLQKASKSFTSVPPTWSDVQNNYTNIGSGPTSSNTVLSLTADFDFDDYIYRLKLDQSNGGGYGTITITSIEMY